MWSVRCPTSKEYHDPPLLATSIITMDHFMYNPELEIMKWRLQVLAMTQQPPAYNPFIPFHLQQQSTTEQGMIKQEPVNESNNPPSFLSYRPGFATRDSSVSPRPSSPSSRSYSSSTSRSPARTPSPSNEVQSEPLDLTTSRTPENRHMMMPQRRMMESFSSPQVKLEAPQTCNHCMTECSSPAALAMHMRSHAPVQGCRCPFCGKSFSRPWLLQGHIRTHTGEKPFSCNQCTKAFADKSNLRAHIQTHSEVKPFSCLRCFKKFALKSYLSKHEESSCFRI